MGVFSSGSVAAQKLIFGFSEAGDLTPYFSNYFDTTTGGKREKETYPKIAKELSLSTAEILFLSDITEELEVADQCGMQTVQLVRPGTEAKWPRTVADFSEIEIKN
jgi:enolase-phosphatase E1